MDFLSKGGYAEVFYDIEKEEVFRRSPRILASTNQIDVTSFNDLIFTKSFEYTNYTPTIHSIDISKEYVSFRMPYYGVPLYKWIAQNNMITRKRYAPYIMAQIIIACIYFEKNGLVHTDLKPSNIMIETVFRKDDGGDDGDVEDEDENGKDGKEGEESVDSNDSDILDIIVRVIDFNSTSIKIVGDTDTSTNTNTYDTDNEWSNAIGTWNYCAPEITLYDQPYNNSTSWSIGIIAACIIDKYPFIDLITKEMDTTVVEQEVWCKFINQWYKKYYDHMPLLRSCWYNEEWKKLIWGCTHWKSSNRWSLTRLYKYVYTELLLTQTHSIKKLSRIIVPADIEMIVSIQKNIDVGRLTIKDRNKIITLVYNTCVTMNTMNVFPTAIALFDRSIKVIEERLLSSINQIAAACFMIACFVNNFSIISSTDHMSILLNTFVCINKSHVLTYMYHIGNMLHWKLWEKPAHVIAVENNPNLRYNTKLLYEHIKDALIMKNNMYKQSEIANHVVDNLRTTPVSYNIVTGSKQGKGDDDSYDSDYEDDGDKSDYGDDDDDDDDDDNNDDSIDQDQDKDRDQDHNNTCNVFSRSCSNNGE